MTWSYSGNPASSANDAIRFLIGDTDTNDQLLSNEEIAWLNLQVTGSSTSTDQLYSTAHDAATSIAAKFTRLADKSIGDFSVSYSQKAEQYRQLSLDLKAQALRDSAPIPYAGGLSYSDKEIDIGDNDMVQPYFRTGQFADVRDGGGLNTNQGVHWFGPGANS